MSKHTITCSMCGQRFDPSAHGACQACPLQKGCQLVCCPACGYENVDPGRSALARLATRWFALRLKEDQHEADILLEGANEQ